MLSIRVRRATLAGFLALPLLASPALAQDETKAAPDPNAVVAKVNGHEIPFSAVQDRFNEMKAQQPQLGAMPLTMVYEHILNTVVEADLVTQAGRDERLESDAEVQKRMAALLDRLIAGAYMQKVVDETVTDEAVKAEYEKRKADFTPAKEVHARHILLNTEEDAKDIIKELDGGADFVELAKTKSTGPSGPQGGDLGFFTKDRMVPPFAEAAFAMEPGGVSKEPVKTDFGWHVIKVEEIRDTEFPPLSEVENDIRDELANKAVSERIESLKEKAEIALFTPDGTPLEEAEPEGETTEEAPKQ
ncbi:MAG: peptidylprolyl isomerase [Rhodospirillum sp.]|nr:peptidylprolyl isomerase [Rhodospirillum sp.]MCF8489540.1 peptidylprolyl isomerase [Rhodospirillum sp.]MCF8499729.1 peptidylprolyl isomerase [Rhodospirillum sp.]